MFDKGGPALGPRADRPGSFAPSSWRPVHCHGLARLLEGARAGSENGLSFEQRGLPRLVYEPDDPASERFGLDERFGGATPAPCTMRSCWT